MHAIGYGGDKIRELIVPNTLWRARDYFFVTVTFHHRNPNYFSVIRNFLHETCFVHLIAMHSSINVTLKANLMNFRPSIARRLAEVAVLASSLVIAGTAMSEPLNVRAAMVPKEQIKLDFKDGSGHFVLMVRREGTASGTGLFNDAAIVEYGRHDIVPGVSGDPSGYLVATKGDGNVAYIKWTVRAIFLPGKDGKPELSDNGFWEVVSGTGAFKGLKGAGTLHIKSANPTDRIFILEGDLVAAQS